MQPRLYTELASWWPLVSSPESYREEAGVYYRTLLEAGTPRTALELGSGGGHNASHMKAHLKLTLVDRAPAMLGMRRKLNPECEHIEGDMRTVRLGRKFDAVFVHDALGYLTSEKDLALAIETVAAHTKKGGVALFAPDEFRETFVPSTRTGGEDADGRSLRYLEWSYDPDPDDDTYVGQYVFVLREGDEPARVVPDRHELGLFGREVWLDLCRSAGLEPEIRRFVHSELAPQALEMILCRRS